MRKRGRGDGQIASLVQVIVRAYRPEKVILFGSRASGHVHKGSDLDFLVIKRTQKNPWERAAELDQWLDHHVPIDVLIYTPAEVEQRLRIGDDFLRTVMRTGRTLYEKAS